MSAGVITVACLEIRYLPVYANLLWEIRCWWTADFSIFSQDFKWQIGHVLASCKLAFRDSNRLNKANAFLGSTGLVRNAIKRPIQFQLNPFIYSISRSGL